MTHELLGLGPYSVKWLLDASPTSVHLYENLEQKGAINAIGELEAKGLVELQIINGSEKYARIVPTPAGMAFQRSIRDEASEGE